MEYDDPDIIRESLINLMVGVISTIDLINQRDIISLTSDPLVSNLYNKSVDDHCAMSIYRNTAEH